MDEAFAKLDLYSANRDNMSDTFFYAANEKDVPISKAKWAGTILNALYNDYWSNEALHEANPVLHIVFIASGRASLEMFVLLNLLPVIGKQVVVTFCDIMYTSNNTVVEGIERVLAGCSPLLMTTRFVTDILHLNFVARGQTRFNTWCIGFNMGFGIDVAEQFSKSVRGTSASNIEIVSFSSPKPNQIVRQKSMLENFATDLKRPGTALDLLRSCIDCLQSKMACDACSTPICQSNVCFEKHLKTIHNN